MRIGRNVKVAADVRSSDFAGRVVRSGESVEVARVPAKAKRAPAATASPAAAETERPAVAVVVNAAPGRGKRVVNDD